MKNIDPGRMCNIAHRACGGTIDSKWDSSRDTAVSNKETIIPSYLDAVRLPGHYVTSKTLIMCDSRDVDIYEQDLIAAKVSEAPDRRVVCTSGTYLMPDIAGAILSHLSTRNFDRIGKKVVMTGALIPINGYSMSDGGFNLGMSLAIHQEELCPRVVIVMNGLCLDVEKGIRKDRKRSKFTSNDGKDLLGYDDVNIVMAGGSIDFVPDGLDGMVPARESSIPDFLRDSVNFQRRFSAVNPFVKDSRELRAEDMEIILDTVRNASAERVVITTGLYRIQEIQRFLKDNLAGEDVNKTVVLTGSRLPLGGASMTDATFNLGYALGKTAFLDRGVHVVLNGMIMGEEKGDNVVELLYTVDERAKLREMGVIGA